jgi:hypothetical protein
VVIDLRPSMKVTIPRDKPRGIQCMPSGFTPVVIDLRPSVKVTIPRDKPAIAPVLDECRAIRNRGYRPTANWYEKHMRMCLVERFSK